MHRDGLSYRQARAACSARRTEAEVQRQQRVVVARAKKQKDSAASSTASSSGDEDLDMVALEVEGDAVRGQPLRSPGA